MASKYEFCTATKGKPSVKFGVVAKGDTLVPTGPPPVLRFISAANDKLVVLRLENIKVRIEDQSGKRSVLLTASIAGGAGWRTSMLTWSGPFALALTFYAGVKELETVHLAQAMHINCGQKKVGTRRKLKKNVLEHTTRVRLWASHGCWDKCQ